MRTKTDLYLIRCLTNLHAGSGESTYGIVDKEVQKDPVELTPVIHASGIKGALRELFEFHQLQDVTTIFGSDTKASQQNASVAGQYYFMEARMLFLPVRSSKRPFYYATSPEIIQRFLQAQTDYGTGLHDLMEGALSSISGYAPAQGRPIIFQPSGEQGTVFIDEYEAEVNHEPIALNLGAWPVNEGNVALLHHDDLKAICGRLPVIARNYLENGISANLWYEEVVPRETLFYQFISRPTANTQLANGLKNANVQETVQIGAHASVGYGLCKMMKFPQP